ncbi:hypothetical protein GCM10011344_13370 [Dokdonia pacifica]|uniref:Uncharacterized protein n=1 Tax=Dokdonia pacifica TaxID=1627892 RepID=A0A238W8L9_9FLAO|nr:hypothetical protein [Dokdonia pacifica]GGG14050.1 hypothetical protein GCM10011344_13370 [Dokdonia pacifica]SNR42945.1 hypothetical protein SAMN06265376_101812 [Dokdonia pacifica]
MAKYYVNNNAQSNGDHEVHKDGCIYLPFVKSKKYLGDYLSCQSAVIEAKKTYSKSNGCYTCSNACHTT